MTEELALTCFEVITYVGTARSCYINAIQSAKEGNYTEAEDLLKQGDDAFAKGHNVHLDLLGMESNGTLGNVGMMMLHAEDQLMSAEAFRTISEEFIAVHKELNELKAKG